MISKTSSQTILNEVADYIEEYGWIQGQSVTTRGCCLSYAWRHVTGDFPIKTLRLDIRDAIVVKIKAHHPTARGVVDFNDNYANTKEDVLNMLRAT